MASAKQPVSVGLAGWLGQVLALMLTAIGVALMREALVAVGWVSGTSWVDSFGRRLASGFGPSAWLVPLGVGLILAAAWLLFVAMRPRPKKTLALSGETGVFITSRGLKNLVHATADQVAGVTSVSVSATRRLVRLSIRATDPPSVTQAVTSAVKTKLAALQTPPRVQVHSRREGGPL